jgi:arylsulfatase A-like enzyme
MDLVGTEYLNNNYPLGWAMAGNTPLKRFKQNVHGAGVRDPLVVHWPAGIDSDAAGDRYQFCHSVDLTPTVLSILGLEAPSAVNGIEQLDIDGVSLARSFSDAVSPGRQRPQIFELFGHRAIWANG